MTNPILGNGEVECVMKPTLMRMRAMLYLSGKIIPIALAEIFCKPGRILNIQWNSDTTDSLCQQQKVRYSGVVRYF